MIYIQFNVSLIINLLLPTLNYPKYLLEIFIRLPTSIVKQNRCVIEFHNLEYFISKSFQIRPWIFFIFSGSSLRTYYCSRLRKDVTTRATLETPLTAQRGLRTTPRLTTPRAHRPTTALRTTPPSTRVHPAHRSTTVAKEVHATFITNVHHQCIQLYFRF